MSYKRVSVLLPTRKRVSRLARVLDSIYGNGSSEQTVEVVMRCDVDDRETQDFLNRRGETFIAGPRWNGYASLPRFMNQCAKLASGDVLLMCNDDCAFETPQWDREILSCANRFQDGIFNIGVQTHLNDHLFPFSTVSRRLFETLGYVNDERLVFSDIFLYDVMHHFGRTVRLPTVTIRHEWASPDEDSTRLEAKRREDTIVFDGTPGDAANPKGNWKAEYRALHEQAVREAVRKIEQAGVVSEATAPADGPPFAHGPLEAPPEHPGRQPGRDPDGASSVESFAFLADELICRRRLNGAALLVPLQNMRQLRVWRELVGKVLALRDSSHPDIYAQETHGNCSIFNGSVGCTNYLYQFRDYALGYHNAEHRTLDLLILEDFRYEVSMANYFIFRKALNPRGAAVVFGHTPRDGRTGGFNNRFVEDLRSGRVDGTTHNIVEMREGSAAAGYSIECFGGSR